MILLSFATVFSYRLQSQINYVPNPGFDEVEDCDLEYGEIFKATPWMIVADSLSSPDLYHACSNGNFYQDSIISSCQTLGPKTGGGMAGIVSLIAEERIYVRLLDTLPKDVDIYVAYSVIARSKCENPFTNLCYSNAMTLAFSDYLFENRSNVLELDGILDETDEWTLLQTCYRARGIEQLLLIGNYRLASETLMDCTVSDPSNFSYTYVDDVIVAPFEVLPDTLLLCGEETIDLNVEFFDIPIRWADGVSGGARAIEEEGVYIVQGDLGNCYLADTTVIISIPEEPELIEIELCEEETFQIRTPVPALWPDGNISTTFTVFRPGVYPVTLLSECGEHLREYKVEASECNIQFFVPNIFSPNDDGTNDALPFYFTSAYEYEGSLVVYDRWGNLLYEVQGVNSNDLVHWNGIYRGKKLAPGVYLWAFSYRSEKDGKTRFIAGDVTLVR